MIEHVGTVCRTISNSSAENVNEKEVAYGDACGLVVMALRERFFERVLH
jgi:hypothetical protein